MLQQYKPKFTAIKPNNQKLYLFHSQKLKSPVKITTIIHFEIHNLQLFAINLLNCCIFFSTISLLDLFAYDVQHPAEM